MCDGVVTRDLFFLSFSSDIHVYVGAIEKGHLREVWFIFVMFREASTATSSISPWPQYSQSSVHIYFSFILIARELKTNTIKNKNVRPN